MSDQWADPAVKDGDLEVATPIGLPVFSSPIRAFTTEYVFTQEWMQLRKDHTAADLNSKHPSAGKLPDYSSYLLVAEGPKQDVGCGLIKWQRTYAKVPAKHDEFESYSYPFIGLAGLVKQGNQSISVTATGRQRTTHTVTSRVLHEYFLTGPGTNYKTAASIPIIYGQRYYAETLIPGAPPLETDYLNDVVGLIPATSPSRTDYVTWTANAATLGFDGEEVINGNWASLTTPSQFVAEDSRLSRWLGLIFLRQTRFILAQ